MKIRLSLLLTILIISTAIVSSCGQKFPVPAGNNEGILVIPQRTTNNTKSNKFAYNYYIKYHPETPVKIRIVPSISKDFYIFENFPAGTYQITSLESFGISNNSIMAGRRGSRSEYVYKSYFEIKPNQITVLNRRLAISKIKLDGTYSRQNWSFSYLDESEKQEITDKLKQLENVNLWTFYE